MLLYRLQPKDERVTILFLHGFGATTGGFKPTYFKSRGLDVLNPQLSNDDFEAAVATAQAAFATGQPAVVVGSSRGGAVAMNIDTANTPLVLICPAWRHWGAARTVKMNTTILHSPNDEVIPFQDSVELVRFSGLPESALLPTGNDHRLVDEASLDAQYQAIIQAASRD
jgi:alpha-beta hydrolase superfamily lysophospholipase